MESRCSTVPVAEMVPVIKESIARGTPVEMTVTGNSMLPLLKDRVSSVSLSGPDDLQIGDIVLFERHDGHYVLHRIVGMHSDHVNGTGYDILGDNQYVPDRNVGAGDIIAKVVAYSRDGRRWRDVGDSEGWYLAMLPLIRNTRHFARRVRNKLIREFRRII